MAKKNERKKIYRVGFVGYCPPSEYDENQAEKYIKSAFDKIESEHPNEQKELVSGATNVGTLKQAYEEAYKRGWKLTGIACKKAKDYPLYPHLDKKILVGNDWGEESPKFLQYLLHGVMVKVGGGKQSKREANEMRKMGNKVLEYNLSLQTPEVQEKGIEKIVGTISLIFLILGFLLFIPILTGNTINNLNTSISSITGVILLIIGLCGEFFWLRVRK